MHLILLTRGIQQQVDLWKMYMQTQMFPWKRQPLLKDKKGEFIKKPDGTYERGPEELTAVQGALRPIQFYEYIFPKEALPQVLGMMNIYDKNTLDLRPEVAGIAWLFRKFMKAKPVPVLPELQGKQPQEITNRFVPTQGIATYPIGIKDDPIMDYPFDKDQGWYQEGL